MPVICAGNGKDVLFLHGYLSNKESFYYQIKFLSQFFKVTAPDIIGFGSGSRLEEAFGLNDYCLWLEKFMLQAKIEKPHVIAHSFGARMAFKYLSAHPDAAEKLIVTGGAGLVKPRTKEYMRRVKAYRRVKKFFPKFAEKHFGSSEYKTLSPVMRESYKKIVNEDLKECVAKINNQTLLIYGNKDSTTPWNEEGVTFNTLIKGSRLEIIEGGHFCFSENKDVFNKLIYDFLI